MDTVDGRHVKLAHQQWMAEGEEPPQETGESPKVGKLATSVKEISKP
jgi:hypothetical protein